MSVSPYMIMEINQIPAHVIQMHEAAKEGKADKYLSRGVFFKVSPMDVQLFPVLEGVDEVYLLYTTSRGVK